MQEGSGEGISRTNGINDFHREPIEEAERIVGEDGAPIAAESHADGGDVICRRPMPAKGFEVVTALSMRQLIE